MKILSIKLTNFKIHSQAEFNFSDGVNALLGKNGSGKSSIVDAIGIGLFNANTSLSEFITYGQVTAKITINFLFKNKLIYTCP
ncbi:MAG: AAA family ATPase [Nitrosarchaeum sp.]|nr:AAA family ATPase [Nitrosarchaeum sp.]